jgi:hypothetical protein
MNINETPEWKTWRSMRSRCRNPRAGGYKNYGARGIRVCARWDHKGGGFANFLADMGPRPSSDHSIDRIDVNGDYEPTNCRWATAKEQHHNMRPCQGAPHKITVNGRTLCLSDWAAELGIHPSTITRRLSKGWDPVRAVTQPRTYVSRGLP